MMFLEEIQKNLEEIEHPEILYKYRDWKKEFHDTIIWERVVYFAPPSSFEDKIDCKNPIRYDLLTDSEILQKYRSLMTEQHPKWNEEAIEQEARDWARRGHMRDPESLRQHQEFSQNENDKRLGVLSLTADPANMEMWEKYAAGQTGFCVGIDPKIAFQMFGGGGIVTYVHELPIIYPTPKHTYTQQYVLQVFCKLDKWAFEKEYRSHKFHFDPDLLERKIQLPPEAFKEIIFGALIDDFTMTAIIDITGEVMPHVRLRQVKVQENTILLSDI